MRDAGIRKLLGDLAEVERRHYATAESLKQSLTEAVRGKEEMRNGGCLCCRSFSPDWRD